MKVYPRRPASNKYSLAFIGQIRRLHRASWPQICWLHLAIWPTASQHLGVQESWCPVIIRVAMRRKAKDLDRPTQQFKHVKWHRATQRWAVELPNGTFTTLDQKGFCFPSENAAATYYAQVHGVEKSSLRRRSSTVQVSRRQFLYVYWHAASGKWSVKAPSHQLTIKDKHGKPFTTQRKAADHCAGLLGCTLQTLRLQASRTSGKMAKKMPEKVVSQYHGVCRLRDQWVCLLYTSPSPRD